MTRCLYAVVLRYPTCVMRHNEEVLPLQACIGMAHTPSSPNWLSHRPCSVQVPSLQLTPGARLTQQRYALVPIELPS